MAKIIHIGTMTTLAEISKDAIDNTDIAYVWHADWTRKMVYDSTEVYATETAIHPYFLRPFDYVAAGVWIEDLSDRPEAWDGSSIATGVIRSTNWSASEGSEIDLDTGTIKLGGSSTPAFSVTAAGVLTATGAIITGAISAATIDIGGDDASSFHVDIDGGIWSGASIANKATAPFKVSNAGALVAASATISGEITATTGAIGGWIVTADYIKDIAGVVGLSSLVTGGDDVRFWAGHATPGSAPFRVTEAGALVATSATITGAVTITSGSGVANLTDAGGLATSDRGDLDYTDGADVTASNTSADTSAVSGLAAASVAGWAMPAHTTYIDGGDIYTDTITATQINVGTLSAISADLGTVTAGTLDIGGSDATSFHVAASGNIWSGAATYNIATNPFAVSSAGVLRAVSGTVGGFTLDATAGLYSGTGATRVQMKPGVAGVGGIWTGATAVADALNYLDVDGSGWLADGNISWTAAGVLTATLNDGGTMTLDAGADIILTGAALLSDPSELMFKADSTHYYTMFLETLLDLGVTSYGLSFGPSSAMAEHTNSMLIGENQNNKSSSITLRTADNIYFNSDSGTGTNYNYGSFYISYDCSALTFTDRTPFYDGDALTEIKNIKGKNGKIDHASLPTFAKRNIRFKEEKGKTKKVPGRDLGAMISILTVGMQQVIERLEKLEK